MNKRGQLFDVIIWLIIIFIMFIFFVGFKYGFNILTNTIVGVNQPVGNTNVSQIGTDTFGQVNVGLDSLKWLALVITVSMILSIMISNFLIKAHPVFFIVYILITIIAVVLSVYLSNAYESILTSGNVLTQTLQSYKAMNYIMLYLPIWTTIVGIMGAIFLFIGVTLDREQGGSIPV